MNSVSSIIPSVGCNAFPDTSLINWTVPSIPWYSKPLPTTPVFKQDLSSLVEGLKFTSYYMWTTSSNSENLTQWKKNSAHPYHTCSKLTYRGVRTVFLAPHFNGPITIKGFYQSVSPSQNYLNTHHHSLALATVKGTPSLLHTDPVSLLAPFPSQNYPRHIILYSRMVTKAYLESSTVFQRVCDTT